MTLHIVHSTTASTTQELATAVQRDRPTGGPKFEAKSEEGVVASSRVQVDDTAASLDIVGLRRAWVWESAESAGNQMIWTGFIGDRETGDEGGPGIDFVTGSETRWDVELVESNQLLSRRLITGADGDRPAETDVQRIQWLLTSGYLSSVGNTLGYFNTSGGVDMDKTDLRGQSAYDLLFDCANRSNKNFFLVYTGDTSPPSYIGTYSLWYDWDYSANYRSTLLLTNIDSEVDESTTFAVHKGAKLRRTPARVFSGAYVRHVNGAVYLQDTDTGNAFAFRDTAVTNPNVNTQAVATALATRYLGDSDTEEDRITCSYTVPRTKVNILREGQACQLKHTRMPGYRSDYSWVRCLRRSVEYLSDTECEISVDLVAAPAAVENLTTTYGQLMRPNGNNYQGGGTVHIQWNTNGDNPQAGDTGTPLEGLIEYVGSMPNQTGLRVLGNGLVDIRLAFSVSEIVEGNHTFTATILVDGAVVATGTQVTTGGLRSQGWELGGAEPVSTELTVSDVTVQANDFIEARLNTSTGTNVSALPTGVGNSEHWLIVTGNLA